MIVTNGKPVDMDRLFLFPFGAPLVCPTVGERNKTWKFNTRNDLGIYAGHPDGMARSSLVIFPFTGQVLVRGMCLQVNIDEKEFERYSLIKNQILKRLYDFC